MKTKYTLRGGPMHGRVMNWHGHIVGNTDMRPGIAEPKGV